MVHHFLTLIKGEAPFSHSALELMKRFQTMHSNSTCAATPRPSPSPSTPRATPRTR